MSNAIPKRCRTCWRTGHTSRAHAGLTSAELEQVKAEGREFMARGFRELGEPAPDGDLLDQLRADTERAELADQAGTSVPGGYVEADPAVLVQAVAEPLAPEVAEALELAEPAGDWPTDVKDALRAPARDLLGPLQDLVDRARAGWPAPAVGDFPAGFRGHFGLSPEVPNEEGRMPAEFYGRADAGQRIAAAERTPPDLVGPEPNYTEFALGESGQMMVLAANPGGWAPKWSYVGEQGPQFAPWRTPLGPDGPKLITLPGVYDLEAAEYHSPAVTGDWLSNSDARQLIGKGCPAQFRYDRDHGVREENDAFAMGHAVHARILGKGETIAVRPLVNPNDPEQVWDSWRTNASKAWRAEQEAAGRSVIVPEQAEVVEAMAVMVHFKPDAHRLLSQPGRPEMSLFWVDPETGVRRRAMVDYLPSVVDEYGVMEPVDIKSADEVAPNEDMERKLYNHAWHRQGTTIADGIIALGLATDVVFHFVVQSKKAPHLVTVVKLDAEAERIGHIENREALHVYRRCLETDEWPDFTPQGPVTLTVPVWVARLYEEDIR